MSNIFYFAYQTQNVYEGGMARNNAFYNKFRALGAKIFNVYSENKFIRLGRFFRCMMVLFFLRRKTVLIHQSSILVLFPVFLFRYKAVKSVISFFLKRLTRHNKVIVEVNDLPYEQAIDLILPVNSLYLVVEDVIYNLDNCHFVFASHKMREYIIKKYNLKIDNTQVIINGSPRLSNQDISGPKVLEDNDNKVKYVYAGGLNKGRNIEDILTLFINNPKAMLVLLGKDGGWINDMNLPSNIVYLGNFNEEKAHSLIATCDIGLIPYDDKKFYYNLCFPTKVSFYLTAGIPVLCTKLEELMFVFGDKQIVQFVSLDGWHNKIANTSKQDILRYREEVSSCKNFFHWDVVLDSLKI